MARNLRTRVELLKPITGVTCARCGSNEAIIYPDPMPYGTMFCPRCSPAWVKSFVESLGESR